MMRAKENNSKHTTNRMVFAFILVFASIWYILATTSVYGATRTNKVPITCYGLESKRYTTWSSVNGSQTGYINGTADQCIIRETYENGWCRVEYPTSRGKKTAYTWMEFFFCNTEFSPVELKAGQRKTVYRKSDCKAKLGTVYSSDNILIIGQSGNATQIIYPVSSRSYKMGWVSGSIGDHNPQGCLDKAEVNSNGTLTVAGWVFDRDNLGKSLDVHVYIGGKFVAGFPANQLRKDVNQAYPGVGEYHGFSYTIPNINQTGTQTVKVYGINVGAGNNHKFGEKTINFGGSGSFETYYVTTKAGLCLRKSASTSGAKITTMPYAAAVSVHSTSNGWAYLTYNGKTGYASTQYLSKIKPNSNSGSDWDSKVNKTVANINSYYYTNGNLSYKGGYKGQCTWYAYGRFYEVTGIALKSAPHAKYWLDRNKSDSRVSISSDIKPRSIAVRTSGSYGHVMFVEEVTYSNSHPQYVYFTECNADGNGKYNVGTDCIVKKLSYSSFVNTKKPTGYIVKR